MQACWGRKFHPIPLTCWVSNHPCTQPHLGSTCKLRGGGGRGVIKAPNEGDARPWPPCLHCSTVLNCCMCHMVRRSSGSSGALGCLPSWGRLGPHGPKETHLPIFTCQPPAKTTEFLHIRETRWKNNLRMDASLDKTQAQARQNMFLRKRSERRELN